MGHLAALALQALSQHGYIIILVIMIVEEAGVPSPLPGDGLLLLTGYLISLGVLDFSASLLTIIAGACAGATILYWVGRRGGRSLVHRYGRLIRVDKRHLDELRRLFSRFGPAGPGVARLVPGLRIYSSALAGLAEIPYPVFLLNVVWAALLWAVVFLLLGRGAGTYWQSYTSLSERLGLIAAVLAVVAAGGFVWLRRWRRRVA
jgi:membrane protein DedA with SNARE-associated domain